MPDAMHVSKKSLNNYSFPFTLYLDMYAVYNESTIHIQKCRHS